MDTRKWWNSCCRMVLLWKLWTRLQLLNHVSTLKLFFSFHHFQGNNTPFHYACDQGHFDSAEVLLQAGGAAFLETAQQVALLLGRYNDKIDILMQM